MRVRVLGREVSPWGIVLGVSGVSALCTWILTASTWRLNNDSFDYLILARNFLAEGAFTQLGLPELNRPLGYPALTSAMAWVVEDLELAGHLVSALCGVLAIPATFWLARQVTSVSNALIATVLLGLNGYLIHAGSRVMTETAAMLFLTLAVGFAVRTILSARTSLLAPVLFGVFSSLAYLSRNELLLFFPMGLLALALREGVTTRQRLASLAIAAVAMACTSAPHWTLQSRAAGHFSVGGNSVNLIWFQSDPIERPPASLDPAWAPRPLDPRFPHKTHPVDFSASRYIAINTPELMIRFVRNGVSYLWPACEIMFFGLGVPLFVLGLLWVPRGLGMRATLPMLFAFLPVVACGFRAGTARLLIPYLPFTSIFIAVGFARALERATDRYGLSAGRAHAFAGIALALLLVGPLSKHARHIGREEFRRHDTHRAAGELMRARSAAERPLVVMAREPGFGYFAEGEELRVPDTDDPGVVVEQMDRFGARFLVLPGPGKARPEELVGPLEHAQLTLVEVLPDEVYLYERSREP